jgi:hypothetical protein
MTGRWHSQETSLPPCPLQHIARRHTSCRSDAIKSADIRRFKAEQLVTLAVRRKPMSKKTVNKQLTVLRKTLVHADIIPRTAVGLPLSREVCLP